MSRIHSGSKTKPKFKCPKDWCCKKGRNGFLRLDNYKRHILAVHGEEYWKRWSSAQLS
jgi:hypothetical protein